MRKAPLDLRRMDKGQKAGAIGALAGARAFPPLMIILYHFSEGHHYSGVHWFDRIVTRGYLWVEFFFALSGFILTYAYRARRDELLTWRGYGAFLRARLIRLYPLHLFMLLWILGLVVVLRALAAQGGYVSIFDLPWHQDVSLKGFLLSLALAQGWHTMDRLTWNGLAWFVSVEFALCLVFPLLLRLTGNDSDQAWRGAGLIGAGLAGLAALLATSPHGLDITFDYGLLRGLSEFVIGMGMAVLFAAVPRGIPGWVHSLAQLLLLACLVYSFTSTGWSHTGNDIFTVVPLIALVFALAFDRGVIARLLQMGAVQRLGEWSYGVYLGQTAWLLFIRFLEQRAYPPPHMPVPGTNFAGLIWWLEPLLLVITCVLWGGLLAEWIERPAAAKLRNYFGRRLDPKSVPTPS
jgi:peptidoglycan/LPS O-acetylase OafA/YrhL